MFATLSPLFILHKLRGHGCQAPPPLNCALGNITLILADNATIVDYTTVDEGVIRNFTNIYMETYAKRFNDKLQYCVKDRQSDLRSTFGYAGDPVSLNKCQATLNDGLEGYICRSAEIKLYFESILKNRGQVRIYNPTYCDYSGDNSSRIPACGPGFMSKVATEKTDNPQYSEAGVDIPDLVPCRSPEAFKCCPGFFCPVDLACMIPCPLGAYCPLANDDSTEGSCSPYAYIPSNIPAFNHASGTLEPKTQFKCGGADKWTVSDVSTALFCSAGSFCNATTMQHDCPAGSYCRMGDVAPAECGWMANCDGMSSNQDQLRLGIIVLAIILAGMALIKYLSNWILKRRIAYVDRKKAELATALAEGDTFGARFNERLREVEYGMHRSFKITSTKMEDEMVRQKIELEFVNLCLRLKRTRKPLLRNITGKLLPGQVTAVMGPSGAGKTTFLTAVAGKASNATEVTGTVKINGTEGDLRNYRRIIGFVPQDDIVHSDLTVRENLAFSASYRLPKDVDSKKREKIIDRVTDMLGLFTIQHSLVGSVAKRGISGGQRKRVNVGMEMVMEPSLLILDEPTSGLDSTSSRLVIEALRLEALRGVNIGVVLHQPSYTIFHMFDNVMFFAKGGYVVYQGPVKEVEDYFAKLGYIVRDKINPPDFFMDVLEGKEESANPNMKKELLPAEWAKCNGFALPEDKEEQKQIWPQTMDSNRLLRGPKGGKMNWHDLPTLSETLAPLGHYLEDLWRNITEVCTPTKDFSDRRTPGFLYQFFLIIRRCAKQRYLRGFSDQVLKLVIMLVGGLVVGALSQFDDKKMGIGIYFPNLLIALSLLVMISSLPTFNADVLNYYRESASGIDRMAYFLAKDILDLLNAILLPTFFNITFYSMKNPKSTIAGNLVISAFLSYGIMGYAYIFAVTLPPSSAQMSVVMFSLASVLLNSGRRGTGFKKFLQDITFARWAQEAFIVVTTNRYAGVYFLTRCAILKGGGFNAHNYSWDLFALVVHGWIARTIAFVCLIVTNRDKQR